MFKVEMKMPISLDGGDVTHTMVSIMCIEPYTVLTAKLNGDQTMVSDEKLVEMVKEEFYNTTYFNRAEKEYVEQIRNQLKDSNDLLDQVQIAMFEAVGVQFQALEDIKCLKKDVERLKKQNEVKK